jgi:hypothetical protein
LLTTAKRDELIANFARRYALDEPYYDKGWTDGGTYGNKLDSIKVIELLQRRGGDADG